jgi:pyruvate/2-oxoglutarate dehydrogenase complex dihydrolipoamide acyltransferase (E2) component
MLCRHKRILSEPSDKLADKEQIAVVSANSNEDQHALRLNHSFPIKGIRKFIASRLGKVWQEAVHVTLHKQIDVTYLFMKKSALPFSLIDYLLFGLTQALKEDSFKSFNAYFDGQLLQSFASVNLGLATDHPKGLIVPVLHHADEMSMDAFVRNRKALIQKALEWKHTPEQLENCTFTTTNLGTLGVDYFTPILNPPQVAILGIGRVKFESVSYNYDDSPTLKAMLPLSLTIDHRILDGADAAKFTMRLESNMLELAKSHANRTGGNNFES